jgi:hypothetical protein
VFAVLVLTTFCLRHDGASRINLSCVSLFCHYLHIQYLGWLLENNGDKCPLIGELSGRINSKRMLRENLYFLGKFYWPLQYFTSFLLRSHQLRPTHSRRNSYNSKPNYNFSLFRIPSSFPLLINNLSKEKEMYESVFCFSKCLFSALFYSRIDNSEMHGFSRYLSGSALL